MSQANAEAPPLSIASISSTVQVFLRKRAGSSSRSKKKPLAGSIEGRALPEAPPMPPSAVRAQVFWRGPYCWERWRYSEKEWWELAEKSAGREPLGLAG